MKDKIKKYRPCLGRTLGVSILLFFMSFALMLQYIDDIIKYNILLYFSLLFSLVDCIFIWYSFNKLNSYIYFDDNKMFQKQYGQIIEIRYDDIIDFKLSFAYYIKVPYALKIYDNKNKMIMFEIVGKAYDEFMDRCSNVEIKRKIKRLFKEKTIY